MGEAKRRGSFGERKEQAEESAIHELCTPVDPDTFRRVFDVFVAAAASSGKTQGGAQQALPNTTTPIAHAIKAATEELASMGMSNGKGEDRYLLRLMEVSQVLKNERFSPFIVARDNKGVEIKDALIRAIGSSRFVHTPEYVGLDLDDLFEKAASLQSND